MGKFLNYLRYLPKQVIIPAAAVIALAVPAVAMASWSPDRPTFTQDEPASYVTFNSITDNKNYGDERTFHDVKDAAISTSGGFKDQLKVQDGQELLLRAYVHNNAAANLELDAENTRVRFLIPTATSENLRTISYISADNATPKTVSDTVDLYADQPFALDYVEGSAIQYTNAVPAGIALSDTIVADGGALIGYDKADGNVPGCFKYASIVTIKVKVTMAEVDIEKTVRKAGADKWVDEATDIKPGDILEYRLKVTNSGSSKISDLTVGDNLPPYVTYIKDSANYYTTNYPQGRTVGNNLTTGGSILSGTYAPGAVAYVVFKAQVAEEIPERCGTVTLVNVGVAGSESAATVQDKATAKVDTGKECRPTPKVHVAQCDVLNFTKFNDQTKEVTASVKGFVSGEAEITGYKIAWGDGTVDTNRTDAERASFSHTYKKHGDYKVVAHVNFLVEDKTKVSKTAKTCVNEVSFEAPVVEKPEDPQDPTPVVKPQPTGKALPETGAASILFGAFGTGGLGVALRNWLGSRRSLKNALLSR